MFGNNRIMDLTKLI